MNEYLLRIENLSLKRDGRELLSQIDLKILPGEVHGLLGPNGCGKSSLAYVLMGCADYTPSEGRLWFVGQDITHQSISARARLGLTLAWQEPARFEGLTVGAYLALGAGAATGANHQDQRWLAEALEAVALEPKSYLHRHVDRALSGGERKRIELAAVFAMHPQLAILDEPDSGVDVLSLGDIAALIRHMASQGTAVLLITHRDEILTVADRASLMAEGRIVFQGNPSHVRQYYSQHYRFRSGNREAEEKSERHSAVEVSA